MAGTVANRREAPFLRRRMLDAMALARYAPRNEGHFAPALPDYLHFASPIRRYADVLAHRALAAHLDSGEIDSLPSSETAAELAESCSRTERAAESADRVLLERRITRYLAARLGDAFPARVSALGRFGLEVELDEVPVTGTVPMETLLDDRYRFHRQTHSLRGRATGRTFRLGDPLESNSSAPTAAPASWNSSSRGRPGGALPIPARRGGCDAVGSRHRRPVGRHSATRAQTGDRNERAPSRSVVGAGGEKPALAWPASEPSSVGGPGYDAAPRADHWGGRRAGERTNPEVQSLAGSGQHANECRCDEACVCGGQIVSAGRHLVLVADGAGNAVPGPLQ